MVAQMMRVLQVHIIIIIINIITVNERAESVK